MDVLGRTPAWTLLERLRKKVRKIEEILGEKFEVNPDKVFTSMQNDPNTESPTNVYEQSTNTEKNAPGKVTEKQNSANKSQAANEAAKPGRENSSHKTEKECVDCSDIMKNCSPPRL